jgi:hypothetical protein
LSDGSFDKELNDIQENQVLLISRIRDKIELLLDRTEIGPIDRTLIQLFGYFSGRSQTISVLVSDNLLFDAEIILRSFNECFAKICFICYQEEDRKLSLVNEFWSQLGLANNQKRCHRAKKAEALARSVGENQGERVLRALSNGNLYDFSDLNRKERKALEQKWSFSEILKFLDSGVVKGAPPNAFSALTHMYGLQSHLVHCDETALDLIADDASREPGVRMKKSKAHACRIWSDQISLWVFAYTALERHFGEDVAYSANVWSDWKLHVDAMEPFLSSFWETQAEFYEKYAPTL